MISRSLPRVCSSPNRDRRTSRRSRRTDRRSAETISSAGGAPVADALFGWYMAALLVGRQLKTCIRHVAPGLPQIADHLFEAAETILEDGRFRAGLSRV